MTFLTFVRWWGALTLIVLAIDALGFICWALSGQTPLDNAYIGTITAHVLRFILGI